GRMNGIAITTEAVVYEFVFTAAPETHEVILVVEMGSMEGFAEGVVTIHEAVLNEAIEFQNVNLLANPSFESPLNETTPEWKVWSQNWGSAPTVVGAIDTVAGVYTVDITNGGGDAAWAIQLQSAFVALEQGTTYRVKVTMSASAARTVNIAVGWTNPDNNAWTEFARMNAVELTDEAGTTTIIFTAAPATHDVILVVEMGSMEGFAEGVVTVYDAAINAAVVPAPVE
ncbi:MAG TPA: carbohydrate binding domain-containing protein, partial [Candidatus Izemoplasmatales bacterium]|nr:carbohydrate binding domain-containing protein [Candidatus Izemoplasmatales bacterium]